MSKKEVLRLVIFNLIFVFILMCLTYIIRTNGDTKDIFTGFYAQKNNTVDVVMIGSSPVYPFYSSPKIYKDTGITAYPLSSNVQRPKAMIPLIKEAEKSQNPKLYVLEMRMFTFEEGRMFENMAFARGVTDNMKYSFNRIATINRLIPSRKEMELRMQDDINKDQPEDSYEDRYTYYFDIFKYHSNWKTLVLKDQLRSVFYNKKNPLMGFVIRDEVGPLLDEEIPNTGYALPSKDDVMPIPAEQEERLYELLDYLKENDIKALFIVSPYNVTEEQMKMFNYITPIIESYGFTFDNMNDKYDEIGIDFKTDYYDYGGHVNLKGAEKCTEHLEVLLKQFDLPDHRGDNRFTAYDEAAGLYEDKSAEALSRIEDHIKNETYAER